MMNTFKYLEVKAHITLIKNNIFIKKNVWPKIREKFKWAQE